MTYSYKFKRKKDSFWHQYSKDLSITLSNLDGPTLITTATIAVYVLVVFVGAYVLLRRTGILPPNAFRRLLWRILVYATPPSLVLALERRAHTSPESNDPFETENSYAATRTFGAKSQAMKNIISKCGLSLVGGSGSARSLIRSSVDQKSRALPGLFNRDNECYQNSVIQSLASLDSFCEFIERFPAEGSMGSQATLISALQAIIEGLNSSENQGRGLWTPWALKSMSSWQQQDAQEYYSRVIDKVERDVKKILRNMASLDDTASLAGLTLDENGLHDSGMSMHSIQKLPSKEESAMRRNPLEGLQAQRVGCLQCGHVEGLSLIPFNCITLSLGRQTYHDLEGLMDTYTDLETIPGVECARCTLLKQEKILQRLIESRSQDQAANAELKANARSRLGAVQTALRDEDYSESTLSKKCQISGKARVLTDKTKQSIIARAPRSLVVHINRSVFDERTGVQLKNYSKVQFPKTLDLGQWYLGRSTVKSSNNMETWETKPSISMLADSGEDAPNEKASVTSTTCLPQALYTLRALITHYGTHGDGHYVAWRQSPNAHQDKVDASTWWRLSDDDVVKFDEETVLEQGGVFMLFYERIDAEEAAIIPSEKTPTQEQIQTQVTEPESTSGFLSSEKRAAVDMKLENYTASADDVVALPSSNKAQKSSLDGVASTMRTASEARPIILESVGGVTVA